jgi:hypothetical protein
MSCTENGTGKMVQHRKDTGGKYYKKNVCSPKYKKSRVQFNKTKKGTQKITSAITGKNIHIQQIR